MFPDLARWFQGFHRSCSERLVNLRSRNKNERSFVVKITVNVQSKYKYSDFVVFIFERKRTLNVFHFSFLAFQPYSRLPSDRLHNLSISVCDQKSSKTARKVKDWSRTLDGSEMIANHVHGSSRSRFKNGRLIVLFNL